MNDVVWDHICGMVGWWHTLAIVNVVILLLLGFSFLLIEPGTGSFVAAVLTLVVVGMFFALYVVVRVQCARYEQ